MPKGRRAVNSSNASTPGASGNVIEVFRAPLSKDQLRALPADDRNLLLLASHAVNQITVLRRVLIFSLNHKSTSELESTLSAAHAPPSPGGDFKAV